MGKSKNILIANGVNLDLLGKRDASQYGSFDLAQLESFLRGEAAKLAGAFGLNRVDLTFFQSNNETVFMEQLTAEGFDGAVVNPAAWTHTSLALADRLAAIQMPFVEVHISHLARREPIRQSSLTAAHACGVVFGLGMHSYAAGLVGLLYNLTGTPT